MTMLAEREPKTQCSLARELETRGIAVIPDLVDSEQLASMQRAFDSRLHHLRWSDVDGYEKTERYRHMVQDVLALSQAGCRCRRSATSTAGTAMPGTTRPA